MYFVRRWLMPVLIEPGSTVVIQTPYGAISKRAAVGEALDRRLAGDVGRAVGEREAGQHRADHHHPAVAALAHPGQQQLGEVHRTQHVDLEQPLERTERQVLQRAALGLPGVVDQDVGVQVLGGERAHEAVDRVRVAQVERPVAHPFDPVGVGDPVGARLVPITSWPRSRSIWAVARPMPEEAPVTRAVRRGMDLRSHEPGTHPKGWTAAQGRDPTLVR